MKAKPFYPTPTCLEISTGRDAFGKVVNRYIENSVPTVFPISKLKVRLDLPPDNVNRIIISTPISIIAACVVPMEKDAIWNIKRKVNDYKQKP